MTVPVTDAYDAIRINAGQIPKGAQAAGYSTGSGVVPWGAAEWAAHPGAVRIDQDPAGSDHTADIYDVENSAGTVANVPRWAHDALADYRSGTRKGQRSPAVYCSISLITPVCNALITGGIRSGIGLWVAHWGIGHAAAVAMAEAGGGPFPVIGVQYDDKGPNGEPIDSDVFSKQWLDAVSGQPPPVPAQPPPPSPEVRISKGNETLRDFAHFHGMTVQQVVWLTAHEKPAGFGVGQGAYVSGGDWNQDLPDGSSWWIGPTP